MGLCRWHGRTTCTCSTHRLLPTQHTWGMWPCEPLELRDCLNRGPDVAHLRHSHIGCGVANCPTVLLDRWTGIVTGSLMLCSPFLFEKLGWRGVAGATPRFMMLTGGLTSEWPCRPQPQSGLTMSGLTWSSAGWEFRIRHRQLRTCCCRRAVLFGLHSMELFASTHWCSGSRGAAGAGHVRRPAAGAVCALTVDDNHGHLSPFVAKLHALYIGKSPVLHHVSGICARWAESASAAP
jgi:hypothetical protein